MRSVLRFTKKQKGSIEGSDEERRRATCSAMKREKKNKRCTRDVLD